MVRSDHQKDDIHPTGLDISIDVVPVTHQVMETTGGLPVDEKEESIESGKMRATGVYAAGSSASTDSTYHRYCQEFYAKRP